MSSLYWEEALKSIEEPNLQDLLSEVYNNKGFQDFDGMLKSPE